MRHLITCPVCRRITEALRPEAKYCSSPCRQVAYRKRKRLDVLHARFRAMYPGGRTPSGQELWERYGSHSAKYSIALIDG